MLEVIACSLEDALEAERGQADRLEVVRELDRGGLTPSLDLVRRIKEKSRLPMRVMLRESETDIRPLTEVVDHLCSTLSELRTIDVDGVVLGFLRQGDVDLETMSEVLSAAPDMPATFHHAFEEARSQLATLEQLSLLPQIDRVLTSGGKGTVSERAARLEAYCDRAGSALTILAGGGIDRETLRVLRAQTSVHEFHTGRAARGPSGNVSADLVSELKEILESGQ